MPRRRKKAGTRTVTRAQTAAPLSAASVADCASLPLQASPVDLGQVDVVATTKATVEAALGCPTDLAGDLSLPFAEKNGINLPEDFQSATRRTSTGSPFFTPKTPDSPTDSRRCFDSRFLVPERDHAEISQRYLLGQQAIGVGGYGQVYIALDRCCPGRTVAIKKLLRNGQENAEALRDEVSIMKDLDHPCIAKLFETYSSGDIVFFVIEHLEGGDLSDRIMTHKRLDEQTTAYLIRQTSSALSYAHSLGIAHRDMKPENVCFCSKDETRKRVKVIDWGLGKYFCMQRMKSGVGSGAFMAPEVFDPPVDGAGYTSACDLWSLGVMTYVALSGKTPFWGSPLQILRRMQDEAYPIVGGVWDGISAEGKDFIRCLLRVAPENRLPVDQLLGHPWLQGAATHFLEVDNDSFHEVLSNLEHFSHAPHFLSICVASVAKQLDHRNLDKLYRIFSRLDINGDGYLNREEMYSGFAEAFSGDIGEAEFNEMFARLDLDGTGKISWTEFCAAGIGEASYTQEHVLWAAFKTFDVHDNGRITQDDLQQVLRCADVNEIWSEDVCEQAGHVMENFAGQDGNIRFEDWLALMRDCTCRHSQDSPRRLRRFSSTDASMEDEAVAVWKESSSEKCAV